VTPVRDAMESLRSAAEDGNARRRQTRMVVISLLVLMTVNLASVLGVGVLFLHDRQRQGRERQNMEVGSKIVSDLYSVANDTNAAVHRIEGSPVPPAAQPPVPSLPVARRSTSTTTTATPRRPPTSPPATSATTTTQPPSPPSSAAPAPSQPPQTTPPTTQPCTTVPIVGTGLCR
jgi:hypothetical protein